MKCTLLTTALFLFFVFSSFGQFSSNLSLYNPAMTGLVDKGFAQLNYGFDTYKNQFRNPHLYGLYNQALDQINSGVGINFRQQRFSFSDYTNVGGSYQYSLNLSESFKWAIGTSLNYTVQNPRGYYEEVFGFDNRDYLRLTFGTAIRWKGLNAGLSVGSFDLINYDDLDSGQNSNPNTRSLFNFHAWYDFNIGDNFILSPSIASFDLYTFGLRGEHSNKIWWNVRYGLEHYFLFGGGVRVIDNLYAGYNIGLNFKFGYTFDHNFSLTYRLGR